MPAATLNTARRKPLTELEQASKRIGELEHEVASLKRKLALECRKADLRAIAEHEKWLRAISPEVGSIQQRIQERL